MPPFLATPLIKIALFSKKLQKITQRLGDFVLSENPSFFCSIQFRINILIKSFPLYIYFDLYGTSLIFIHISIVILASGKNILVLDPTFAQ